MANLTATEAFYMFSLQLWGFDHVISASNSVYEYATPSGGTVELIGADFTYDKDGNPTGGTVQVVELRDSLGNEIASVVLGDAPLADMVANDFANFWHVLLAGDDTISMGQWDDIVEGFEGNDYIAGNGGNDTIYGGDDNDRLFGGHGNDTVYGGDGEDVITFNVENGDDEILGGDGLDTVVHHGLDTTDFGDIIYVEKVLGSRDYDVHLEVGSATNSDDRRSRYPERNEAFLGEVENLEVNGRDGGDHLTVFDLTGTAMENGRITFDGGAGEDNLNGFTTGTALTYLWRFAEGEGHPGGGNVDFGDSTDDIFHLLDEANDGVAIHLGRFVSSVQVDAGISGGGLGPDVSLQNVEYMDFDFGDGDDTLVVNEDLTPAYSGVLDIDFGEGEADLIGTLHTGRIVAIGGNGHNDFFSGAGDDELTGGDTYDYIFGGDGIDTIIGGGGDDELGGDAGDDIITGGTGGDEFFFNIGDGTDTITDFEAGITGNDRLNFVSLGTTEADLTVIQMGAHTHITTEFGDTVILQNVAATDLNSGDFLF